MRGPAAITPSGTIRTPSRLPVRPRGRPARERSRPPSPRWGAHRQLRGLRRARQGGPGGLRPGPPSSAPWPGTRRPSAAPTTSTCSTSSRCPTSTWGHGEQGPQHLQRQVRAGRPETATDGDYAAIEAIIAHEYFHNWSGNRVTCRDWFQLCLKEGLTVFRDQEFSSDMRSGRCIASPRCARCGRVSSRGCRAAAASGAARGLCRDQQLLHGDRLRQGRRDRPDAADPDRSRGLPGRHGPLLRRQRRARRTVEDFLAAFAAVTGHDLDAFARWYERPGTPRLAVTAAYDPAAAR